MTTLYRVRTTWSYTPGGPGYTNMYFGTTDPLASGAQTAVNDVQAFWNAIKSYIPSAVSLQVDPSVIMVEDVTSEQTGDISVGTPPAAIQGTGGGAWAAPAGATAQWTTASYLYGRRVKGRTYLVPLTAGAFQSDGTILDTTKTALNAAAAALVAGASNFVVYTRERQAKSAAESPTGKEITYRPGASSMVVSGSVADRVAVLRSRRD